MRLAQNHIMNLCKMTNIGILYGKSVKVYIHSLTTVQYNSHGTKTDLVLILLNSRGNIPGMRRLHSRIKRCHTT